jgi:DHA3 family macrolide efflux protein-like MFS transporter
MKSVSRIYHRSNWQARFFTIWTGQAFSLLGSQLVQFALIWWLTSTTRSATVLATASLIGLLPQVLLGPVAGALVDRWNRRLVMMAADGMIALATAFLAILFLTGQVEIWHVYALMFIRSAAGGFHWSAMQASVSLMVPKEHLARVQGLNQMLGGGMNIISAPLGALLLGWMSMQGILALDVITALMAIVPLCFIAIPQPERNAFAGIVDSKPSVWQDFVAGLRYAWSWPGLLMIGLMATVINFLLNPAFALMPILVTKQFNGQAPQLAMLESAIGIGILVGGLLLSVWGGFKRRVYTSLVGLIAMGFWLMLVGVLPASAFPLVVAAIFLTGVANSITNGPLMAVVQSAVEPEMQGRVFTLINSMATAMSPISLIIAGPISDWMGVQAWYLVGGLVTLLMGVGALFVPAIIRFEDGRTALSKPAIAPAARLAASPVNGD